jgi:hypothetical protein
MCANTRLIPTAVGTQLYSNVYDQKEYLKYKALKIKFKILQEAVYNISEDHTAIIFRAK